MSDTEQLDLLLAARWRSQRMEQPTDYIVIEDRAASVYRPMSVGVGSLVSMLASGGGLLTPSVGASTLRAAGGIAMRNFPLYAGHVPFVGSLVRRRVFGAAVDATTFGDVEVLARRPGDSALIRTSPSVAAALRSAGVELVEDVPVYPAVARPALRRRKTPAGTPKRQVKVVVSSAAGGRLRGVTVTGMMADLSVDWRPTNRHGVATLNTSGTELWHVWVDPAPGHWSWTVRNIQMVDNQSVDGRVDVTLEPIQAGHIDGLRERYASADLTAGDGVVIGVIDTGVGPHDDLNVQGGHGYTLEPCEGPWTAGDSPHGTHVAGVIASRADPPRRGIAPGVTLRSYRIYEQDEVGRAFSLAAAIRDAVDEGCDVINLSVELGSNVSLIEDRIAQAIAEGVIVVAAAGNGGREPLSFPASADGVIGVAALGRKHTYPLHAASIDHEAAPPGTDPDDYVAAFSNRVRLDDIAAPGVGTISTLPDGQWGVMDGTSQAAPVVTAIVARILADRGLVRQRRSLVRTQAVLKELREGNLGLGFPKDLVGTGLVVP